MEKLVAQFETSLVDIICIVPWFECQPIHSPKGLLEYRLIKHDRYTKLMRHLI